MRRDINIQIIRILAMLSIVICHIVQETNNKYLVMSAQFFNIGVYIFLIISGYLYSEKNIEVKSFYKKRFLKIILPMYIFMIPIFILQIIDKRFQIKYFIIYLFNLQGIFGTIVGTGHLWFLTAIAFCYFMLPILQIIKNKNNERINDIFVIVMGIIAILICYINRILGTQMICLFAFSIGYFYVKKIYLKENISTFKIIGVFFLTIIIRLAMKILVDGTVIYDLIIVGFTQIIASVCIIIFIKKFNKKSNAGKILNEMDKYSFYIYITHYFFIKGQCSVMKITSCFIINILIMVILSIIYAICLLWCTNKIIKTINKLEDKYINFKMNKNRK